MQHSTAPPNPRSAVVFADDWGRHPSSCQHLMAQLAKKYSITWVNTIGMRTPGFDLLTLRRALGKLAEWLPCHPTAPPATTDAQVAVIAPRMWPWFTRPHDRWINQRLLTRTCSRIIDQMPDPVIAVTTIPIVADLVGRLNVRRWVYYCVDDFSMWPGLDGKTMAAMETDLVKRVDTIIAASDVLRQRIQALGRDSTVVTHGVDLSFWKSTPSPSVVPPIANPHSPRVVFWGVVDARLSVPHLEALSQELGSGSILLIGPQQNPPSELGRIPRVTLAGPVPFDELPAVAAAADVLIMPYADLPVTRAMQPLKLKEYLATGKPVVTSDLPAVRPWADCLDCATTPAEFARLVAERLETGIPAPQKRARECRLRQESWASKASVFEQVVFSECPQDGGQEKTLSVPP